MKAIFDFTGSEKRLLVFTERLSELVLSGCSLQKSLYVMGKMRFRDIRLNRTAFFLHKTLLAGTKFSIAMSLAPDIKLPEWYAAFISVSEECGRLGPVLLYLKKLLEHKRSADEKFYTFIIYPVLVVLFVMLGGLLSVFYFLPSFAGLFGTDFENIKSAALKSFLYADIFLLFSFSFLIYMMKKIVSPGPCVNVFRTIAFLSGNSVPVFQSLSCAFSFSERNKKLTLALLEIKNRLLEGEKVADCFGQCLSDAGFKNEGLLLSENLSLGEETGKTDAFERTASHLEAVTVRNEKIFFSVLQPALLLLSAVYITLILKTAFLPFITNSGGLF